MIKISDLVTTESAKDFEGHAVLRELIPTAVYETGDALYFSLSVGVLASCGGNRGGLVHEW